MDVDSLVNYYSERLFESWKKHGFINILVDFDDTLYSNISIFQQLCDDVVNTLKEAKALKARLILWTCRAGDYLEEAIKYAKDYLDLEFVDVNPHNPNSPLSHKAFGHIQLDDRAGLPQALQILKLALYKYKRYLNERNGY